MERVPADAVLSGGQVETELTIGRIAVQRSISKLRKIVDVSCFKPLKVMILVKIY